jgi:hypothetical protein
MLRTADGVAAFWTGKIPGTRQAFTFAFSLGLLVRLTFPDGRVEFPATPR